MSRPCNRQQFFHIETSCIDNAVPMSDALTSRTAGLSRACRMGRIGGRQLRVAHACFARPLPFFCTVVLRVAPQFGPNLKIREAAQNFGGTVGIQGSVPNGNGTATNAAQLHAAMSADMPATRCDGQQHMKSRLCVRDNVPSIRRRSRLRRK